MSDAPVLATIDLTDAKSARAVLKEAIFEAEARDAPLRAMTVIPEAFAGLDWRYVIRGTGNKPSAGERRELVKASVSRLGEIVAKETPDDMEVETLAVVGMIYQKVLEEAKKCHARLVVVAASEAELPVEDIGPNAARIARYAPCPVLLVRPEPK
jgi:universal stress protein F